LLQTKRFFIIYLSQGLNY